MYLSLQLPPHPGVTPPLPIDRYWQLGKDEAIILMGQTPPGVRFFHYQTFAIMVPDIKHRMMLPVGDAINMGTINTIGPGKNGRPIVYIITGNRETERRVRTAALKAGYPAAIINVEAISPVIAPLGVGAQGSWRLEGGQGVCAQCHKAVCEMDGGTAGRVRGNRASQAYSINSSGTLAGPMFVMP